MTPNQLIAEIQKYIEIAREQGWEIGDSHDAVMIDTDKLETRWDQSKARFMPTNNVELKYLDSPPVDPTIVIE